MLCILFVDNFLVGYPDARKTFAADFRASVRYISLGTILESKKAKTHPSIQPRLGSVITVASAG